MVYALAALLVPAWILLGVAAGTFPPLALVALLPSLLLLAPLKWAFGDTSTEVPIPAMAANVQWNLATNTLLGLTLAVASVF